MNELLNKSKKIKLLAFDVDGVLTDNLVWMDSIGEWRRCFSVRDGYGLQRLRESGYQLAIITGSNSEDVRERAKVLKFNFFYEGSLNKMPALQDIVSKTGLSLDEILYMGDDLFDLPLIEAAGLGVTVPEASDQIKRKSDYVTRLSGGHGAVREVCDFIYENGFYKGKTE